MRDKSSPLISVIICTYNTKDLTLQCLNKLKESIVALGKPVETIVVENGNDGTGNMILKKYPWVKVLIQSENTGFAKGNNIGIKAANKKTKYYLLLNTDALVRPDTLRKSLEFIDNHPDCDALGCKLLFENGNLQASAGFLPSPFSILTWIWGIDLVPIINKGLKPVHPKDLSFYDTEKQVGWVMGAYLFMKRKVIETTKGLDENFFLYMEEVEWCKRINDAGFKIFYTPSFEITHLDKASSKKDPEKIKSIFKNEVIGIIYYLKKYYPKKVFWLVSAIKIGLRLRFIAFNVMRNKLRSDAYRLTINSI